VTLYSAFELTLLFTALYKLNILHHITPRKMYWWRVSIQDGQASTSAWWRHCSETVIPRQLCHFLS